MFLEYVQEHRCENHAYIYGHRNGRDCAKIEEDPSVPAGPSISQVSRRFLHVDVLHYFCILFVK